MSAVRTVRLTRDGSADRCRVVRDCGATRCRIPVPVRCWSGARDLAGSLPTHPHARPACRGEVPLRPDAWEVIASRASDLAEGTWVSGELGWADHALAESAALTPVDLQDSRIPVHHYVGLLGLSGITAYFGVTRVPRPKAASRSVIQRRASGGVGQVALQLIARTGASVAGVVGSADKVDAVTNLGFRALCAPTPEWTQQLDHWAPDGLHGYYDNVWGETSARIVERLRPLGRVALCGQMTGLAGSRVPPLDIDWYLILTRSLTLQGFRTVDYLDEYDKARQDLAQWFLDGTVSQRVNLIDGLSAAGAAFADLVNGNTLGKTTVLVR